MFFLPEREHALLLPEQTATDYLVTHPEFRRAIDVLSTDTSRKRSEISLDLAEISKVSEFGRNDG